jgi:hypothetical protein
MRASKARVFGEAGFKTAGSVYPGWQRAYLNGKSIRALGRGPTGMRPNRPSFTRSRLLATH